MVHTKKHKVVAVLDNIRSAHNVGAIFRTADGAGVAEVVLVGYTPTPVDRFGRQDAKLMKTSLGAVDTVPWRSLTESEVIVSIATWRQEGFTIVAVEQAPGSTPLCTFNPPERVVYIFGNEVTGISAALLSVADTVIELPMSGKKESLNVAVTAGIVLYHCRF